jgi:ABC-2 type transport system permease protein
VKLFRVQAVILRQVFEARHNLDRLADMLYWPIVDVLLWGFMSIYLGQQGQAKPGAVNFLLGTAILWGMFRNFQRDFANSVLSEIWARNFIGLFATPLTIPEFCLGLILVNILKLAVGLGAAGLVAWLFYSFNLFVFLPALVLQLSILLLFGLAIGIIVTGLILRYTTHVQTLSWSITGLIMPFSCIFYPLAALPTSARPVALALPTTHAFEGMREVLAGMPPSGGHLLAGYLLDFVYLGAAAAVFVALFRSAASRGLLVKAV